MITPVRATTAPAGSTRVKLPLFKHLDSMMAPIGARKFNAVAWASVRYMIESEISSAYCCHPGTGQWIRRWSFLQYMPPAPSTPPIPLAINIGRSSRGPRGNPGTRLYHRHNEEPVPVINMRTRSIWNGSTVGWAPPVSSALTTPWTTAADTWDARTTAEGLCLARKEDLSTVSISNLFVLISREEREKSNSLPLKAV